MILVTGATGLVGGNLLWFLLQKHETVYAIRRKTSNIKPLQTIFSFYTSNPNDYYNRIQWIDADLLEIDSIRQAMTGIEIVYHCAAVISLGISDNNLMQTNVIGTRNIVNSAIENGIKKLCFVSSIAACGFEPAGKMITENSVWNEKNTHSVYAKSKYESELEVWKGIKKGLNAVIVNPGVILGVSGTKTGSSQLFSQVQKGLAFYTNGGSGYVDVQDVVKAMIQLTDSEITGEKFILISENCSNKDVLSWMADGFGKHRPYIGIGKNLMLTIGFLSEFVSKITGKKQLIDIGTARSAIHRSQYSCEKIKGMFDFQFKPIETCILEICNFISANQN
jgi:nucleoside-diphosphate-sugar epimerase